MDRPSRSLRKLPVRLSAERSKSRGERNISRNAAKEVPEISRNVAKEVAEISRNSVKEVAERPRTSRSRSTGRLKKQSAEEFSSTNFYSSKKISASPSRKIAASPSRKITASPSRKISASPSRTKVPSMDKKSTPTKSKQTSTKTKSPKPKLMSKIKEGIDRVRESLSPELEAVIRRSINRFEEVKTEALRHLTPSSQESVVTTSSALRMRTVENSVTSVINSQDLKDFEDDEDSDDTVIKNHVGYKDNRKKLNLEHVNDLNTKTAVDVTTKLSVAEILFFVFSLGIVGASVLIGHILCSKDDCRLVKDASALKNILNYEQYFDAYTWLAYSLSLVLFFTISRFHKPGHKKVPLLSLLGLGCLVIVLSSLATCQFYFAGLRNLKLLPFISATLIHVLSLLILAGTSSSLLGVTLEPFFHRLSSILALILTSYIAAVEYNRITPMNGVYLLSALQFLTAVDSLLTVPLPGKAGPLSRLFTVLRPFIYVLPSIYISANNVYMNKKHLIAVGVLHTIGYLLYRASVCLKATYLNEPYSQRNMKRSVYGGYIGGPWKYVRHPDLVGWTLMEISFALCTIPSPLSLILPLVSVVSTVICAITLDRQSHPGYIRTVKSSLIPLIY